MRLIRMFTVTAALKGNTIICSNCDGTGKDIQHGDKCEECNGEGYL